MKSSLNHTAAQMREIVRGMNEEGLFFRGAFFTREFIEERFGVVRPLQIRSNKKDDMAAWNNYKMKMMHTTSFMRTWLLDHLAMFLEGDKDDYKILEFSEHSRKSVEYFNTSVSRYKRGSQIIDITPPQYQTVEMHQAQGRAHRHKMSRVRNDKHNGLLK